MRSIAAGNIYHTGMPFSTMAFSPVKTLREKKYSNASQICFWNKECIAKRDAENAAIALQQQQQQATLMQALSTSSGGISTGAIVGIVFGLIAITAVSIYLIKKKKI